jgi:hypothetical protein
MKKTKTVKPLFDRLNPRQQQAVLDAKDGKMLDLIRCCTECQTAIDKADAAIDAGLVKWGSNTKEHYLAIQSYMEGFIDDDNVWILYQTMLNLRGISNG